MGLIDWLTKETSIDTQTAEEKEEKKKPIEDDFDDLKDVCNTEHGQMAQYDDDDIMLGAESHMMSQNASPMQQTSIPNASFTIFKVQDEEDVRLVLKHLTSGAPCIATFENVKKKNMPPIMKFLSGGLFVLGANMSEWQKDAFIIVPNGMSISMQDKARRK